MQQHEDGQNYTTNNVIVCRIYGSRRSVWTGQVACMWKTKNIPNVSAEKSELEGIIARYGFRWDEINWILKAGCNGVQ
jgi:hypothetical protein